MKENEENIVRDGSSDVNSMVTLPEEQMQNVFNEFDKTQSFSKNSGYREQESLEIFKSYLRSLESCARKKRHRNISQELGR